MSFLPSLSAPKLAGYLNRQLRSWFPDDNELTAPHLELLVSEALERVRICFAPLKTAYYSDGQNTYFNHLNGDHYASFLYFVSNCAYRAGELDLASKAFLLNKAMHGLDLFYSVEMPPHFLLVHPLGTVLGKARYGDFLVVYQNVTVGATHEGVYPVIGERTILYSKSSLIGRCNLGPGVTLASNAFLINTDVPANTTVVGSFPHHKFLKGSPERMDSLYVD